MKDAHGLYNWTPVPPAIPARSSKRPPLSDLQSPKIARALSSRKHSIRTRGTRDIKALRLIVREEEQSVL